MASGMNRDAAAISFEAFAELKRQDRAALNALPPDEAQAAAEAILNPRLWQIADPRQLEWPGDLAGDSSEESEIVGPFVPEDEE